MKNTFVGFMLLLLALPVFAADWLEIDHKIYLDKSSIKHNYQTNEVSAWIKILNDGNMQNVSDKKVWFKIINTSFNCSNKTYRNNSYNVYGLKGTVLYSDNYGSQWETIIPDSNADYWFSIVCK